MGREGKNSRLLWGWEVTAELKDRVLGERRQRPLVGGQRDCPGKTHNSQTKEVEKDSAYFASLLSRKDSETGGRFPHRGKGPKRRRGSPAQKWFLETLRSPI